MKDTKLEPGMIRIKQIRSRIATPEKHRRVLDGLGFRKLNQVVVRKDSPEVRGMIAKVPHLVVILDEAGPKETK